MQVTLGTFNLKKMEKNVSKINNATDIRLHSACLRFAKATDFLNAKINSAILKL